MIVIKCPKCGGSFPVNGPPVPLFTQCPACHKTLRLRRKMTERELKEIASAARKRKWKRRLQFTKPMAGVALLIAILMAGRYIHSKLRHNQRESQAGTTKRRSASKTLSAVESQRALARRLGNPITLDPDGLFRAVSPAVVRVVVQSSGSRTVGQGSGFIISENGWVITNYHVIEWADTATVVTGDYRSLNVMGVAAVDRGADLALLKINGADLPCLRISTEPPPPVGTKVYAIGSPEGLQNTLSEGLISGHRIWDSQPVLQTTAPMSYGSSGGPLLSDEGMVIGVNFRIRSSGQNLNFAVPAERILELLGQQGDIVSLHDRKGDNVSKNVVGQLDKAWEAMKQNDLDTADAILKPLAATETNNPFVLFAYGHLHRKRGAYKLAIKAYEAAIRVKPDYAEAYYNIGITFVDREALAAIVQDHSQTLELERQAKIALQRASKYDPVGPIGRAARAALSKYWPTEFPP